MARINFQHQKIQAELRTRIFLAPPDTPLVFRETDLAREFGISRTPIRQILQGLAHEQLVETQTGVGTVLTELKDQDRARDLSVYSQIALAASRVPGNEITNEIMMRIMGLAQMAESEENRSLQLFISLAAESAEATCQIIGDAILADALASSRWRVIRWRIRDFHEDAEAFWDSTIRNFQRTSSAVRTRDASHYLETISGVVSSLKEPL